LGRVVVEVEAWVAVRVVFGNWVEAVFAGRLAWLVYRMTTM